jgi:hypothetical protein
LRKQNLFKSPFDGKIEIIEEESKQKEGSSGSSGETVKA